MKLRQADGTIKLTPKEINNLSPSERYNVLYNDPNTTLNELKQAKINALDEVCGLEITNGFDYTINGVSYHFYLPITAQSNFQGARTQLKEGKITTIKWTVLNNTTGQFERIDIDWVTFEPLSDQVFAFVNDRIVKLRDTLEPQVDAIIVTTTLQDAKNQVDAIVW